MRRLDPARGEENNDSGKSKRNRSHYTKKFLYVIIIAFGLSAFLFAKSLIAFSEFKSLLTMGDTVLVAGSGLAGLSAAIESCKKGSKVLLIDKADSIGGNSAYATSGINAARFEPGMSFDPIISFVDDTLIGGMNMNDKSLVSTMARKSAAAIDFIEKNSELKFDEIVRLGGHSHPRTYRVAKLGSSKPLGKIIVEAFVKTLQECPGAEILTSTSLIDIGIRNQNREIRVHNVAIESNNTKITGGRYSPKRLTFEVRAVILATGGFSSNKSLLSKYSSIPSWVSTTNRKFATGDLLVLGERLNFKLVNLDQVQLHPTSFVSLRNPFQEQRILCPEMFRGNFVAILK
eukprot:GHVP01041904.1.p1 GENE.GHVP01041904.1~~GHVP01041904.1.p1  ORF type:complete len:346 (-),score=60.76 GHVP01041904.1:516-1553(-)